MKMNKLLYVCLFVMMLTVACGSGSGGGGDDGGNDGSGDGGGSSNKVNVIVIGNYNESAIYNPTAQEVADADVSVSGNSKALTINWKINTVTGIGVYGNNTTVYGIVGTYIPYDPNYYRYPITPPIQYGDFSLPDIEAVNMTPPSPALIVGKEYSVTVSSDRHQGWAYIIFTVTE